MSPCDQVVPRVFSIVCSPTSRFVLDFVDSSTQLRDSPASDFVGRQLPIYGTVGRAHSEFTFDEFMMVRGVAHEFFRLLLRLFLPKVVQTPRQLGLDSASRQSSSNYISDDVACRTTAMTAALVAGSRRSQQRISSSNSLLSMPLSATSRATAPLLTPPKSSFRVAPSEFEGCPVPVGGEWKHGRR